MCAIDSTFYPPRRFEAKDGSDRKVECDDWVELCEVNVFHKPLPGQAWRCSENFSIFPPAGIKRLEWWVATPRERDVSFAVAQGERNEDPTVLTELTHGTRTPPVSGIKLYVGEVERAGGWFTVIVYGHFN